MSKAKTVDLTSGPILKTLAELALPIMISSMLGTAYSIMDMAWIGLLGAKAVAGVGVGGMYVWLSQGLSSLARMGGQVNMAHSLGRGDQKTAAGFAQAALQLTILFSLFVTLISILFTNPLLHFFALNDAATYNSARIYMRADPVFLPFPGADRSFHSPGRFQNTIEGKLLWPDTEYDP